MVRVGYGMVSAEVDDDDASLAMAILCFRLI
jgi:hypothetical protein